MQKMSTSLVAHSLQCFSCFRNKRNLNLCDVWWEEILQSVPIMKTILSNRLEENVKTM